MNEDLKRNIISEISPLKRRHMLSFETLNVKKENTKDGIKKIRYKQRNVNMNESERH